jgi:hypothetical protein
LQFDSGSVEYRSLREHWSPFAPECPSEAIIARLLPDLAPESRRNYCLLSNDKTGAYLSAGRSTASKAMPKPRWWGSKTRFWVQKRPSPKLGSTSSKTAPQP